MCMHIFGGKPVQRSCTWQVFCPFFHPTYFSLQKNQVLSKDRINISFTYEFKEKLMWRSLDIAVWNWKKIFIFFIPYLFLSAGVCERVIRKCRLFHWTFSMGGRSNHVSHKICVCIFPEKIPCKGHVHDRSFALFSVHQIFPDKMDRCSRKTFLISLSHMSLKKNLCGVL